MKHLLLLNDPPYGTERVYNALRLAMQIQKDFPDDSEKISLIITE